MYTPYYTMASGLTNGRWWINIVLMAIAPSKYIAELRRRAKESHVYRKYQLVGLAIAETLKDERHKALYIKLAKEHDGERLLALAKDIAERRNVKNRGAYFMSLMGGPSPSRSRSLRATPPLRARRRSSRTARSTRAKSTTSHDA